MLCSPWPYAIMLPHRLVLQVPIVKDADLKSIGAVSTDVKTLAAKVGKGGTARGGGGGGAAHGPWSRACFICSWP